VLIQWDTYRNITNNCKIWIANLTCISFLTIYTVFSINIMKYDDLGFLRNKEETEHLMLFNLTNNCLEFYKNKPRYCH